MLRKYSRWAAILATVLVLCIWVHWGNTSIELSEYQIRSGRIPEHFSGFRIAQISDLHNAQIGENNDMLISKLAQTYPDIIVITGDLIDSRNTDVQIALDFCVAAMQIAPVYYVTGNHEARVREYNDLKTALDQAGIIILDNKKEQVNISGEYITMIGLDDPSFGEDYLFGDSGFVIRSHLSDLCKSSDGYTLLLSHRPELFDTYMEFGIDLVFSGHAHGGQFRLPFVGGLVAPNQGFFPKYDAGLFSKENTAMIVSRGIGNSIIPVRINNRPQIVVAELVRSN